MDDQQSTNKFTHELFAAVGNETRLEILRALWTHRELTFNELYAELDIGDTGHFNYHLSKLLDQLVTKSGDCYRLTTPGHEIILTILSNVETRNPLESPFLLETECHRCESSIQALSTGGWLRIDCESCDKLYASFPVPVAGLGNRSPAEFLEVFDQRLRRMNALVHRGICPNCSCHMTTDIVPDAEPEPGLPFVFDHCCGHCQLEIFSPPGTTLLETPEVITFYSQHDIDLFAVPHWELPWMFDGECVEIVSETPFEYTVDVELHDQQLRTTLDENGEVVTTSRV